MLISRSSAEERLSDAFARTRGQLFCKSGLIRKKQERFIDRLSSIRGHVPSFSRLIVDRASTGENFFFRVIINFFKLTLLINFFYFSNQTFDAFNLSIESLMLDKNYRRILNLSET